MFELLSTLARSDRNPHPTDPATHHRQPARTPRGTGPDPVVLTIGGVLLFIVVMLALVVRTLYPAGF